MDGQKAPSAKRCIKTFHLLIACFSFNNVRKHRAPKGTLRHQRPDGERPKMRCQIAPSTKRCIKTRFRDILVLSRFRCQKAPSAKRCIKTRGQIPQRRSGREVRKHRAPKGALRHQRPDGERPKMRCQIAPSTKRCIKTRFRDILVLSRFRCQKAPSAKRCIKTRGQIPQRRSGREVRKHRAPKGALRRLATSLRRCGRLSVRKHRAPLGALRPHPVRGIVHYLTRQKAPSAIRCIKTRSSSGCWSRRPDRSDSTERQKVH